MSAEPSVCRLCGADRILPLGVIPASDFFAGRVLPQPMDGGCLWQCSACRSLFRHPVLGPSAYLDLYAHGVAEAWSCDGGRQDLAIIRDIVAHQAAAGSVLDIGCGAGGFLLSLPAHLKKYGVEPSLAAAGLAEAQGVSILARTVPDLPPQVRFDVITVIDVIEHVVDPAALLDEIAPHLAPAGCLIVSTGDPESAPWRRLYRARFWYSSFPEHISFPSAHFFAKWQRRSGLEPARVVRTRYRRRPLWLLFLALAAQNAYWLSPGLFNVIGRGMQRLRRMPRPHRRYFSGGGQGVFTDHQVVTIQASAIRSPVS
jgi:SAM-dependent methyltransferase